MKNRTSEEKLTPHSARTSAPRLVTWRLILLIALVVGVPVTLVLGPQSLVWHNETRVAVQKVDAAGSVHQSSAWHVGMLRPDGLRIIPGGRSDASHVLNPNQFSDKDVRHAYWVATQIPATLNNLYCWCGCENRGIHRSNLQCFEDQMAVTCAVCQGTAEIAMQMTQAGVQDAGEIQAAVDAKWAPKG